MKLVILDRDGVINQDSDAYVKSCEEWIPLPGSIEAIAQLSLAGFRVCVATNQSGLARGYFTEETLDAMHSKMLELVALHGGRIDHIEWCPHLPHHDCLCRKPLPGLIDRILGHYEQEEVEECWMIGDSLRDLEAGAARGCHPILVRTGKGERTLADKREQLPQGTRIFSDLSEAVDSILSEGG